MILRNIAIFVGSAAFGWAAATPGFETHYVALEPGQSTVAVATSPVDGSIFVVAAARTTIPSNRIVKTDSHGNMLAIYDFNFGYPNAATVDVQGNLIVVGLTAEPANFPSTRQLVSKITGTAGFVLKLDAALARLMSAVLLGGSSYSPSIAESTGVTAVAADSGGNVYVTGSTNAVNFPVTPGAYQPLGGGIVVNAFVTKLSPDLSGIAFSTYYGDSRSTLSLLPGITTPYAILVDSRGAPTIAGGTNGDIPTAGDGGSQTHAPYPFVARFSPDGGSVEAHFETRYQTPSDYFGPTGFRALTADDSGNTWAAGDAAPPSPTSGYLVKLDASLNPLSRGSVGGYVGFAGSGSAAIRGVQLDAQGNVWVTGTSAPSYLPGGPPRQTSEASVPYIAQVLADGSTLSNLLLPPFGGLALTKTSDGSLVALGSADAFLLSNSIGIGGPFVVTSSANNISSGTVAPGELVSLYGTGIGPTTAMSGEVVKGAFTNQLGGYQVLFNDLPAPLLYIGPNQINTVVPEGLAFVPSAGTVPPTSTIRVVGPDGTRNLPSVTIVDSHPQIFPVVLNQDGTVNSASNPARPGSMVTAWATGLGYEDTADGSIVQKPIWNGTVSIVTFFSGKSLEVLYASDAPNSILGLTQINFTVPAYYISGFAVSTSTATSTYVGIHVSGP